MPQGPGRDERIEELVDTLECPVCLDTADTAPIYQVTTFQLLEYQWSEGEFDTLGKLGSAHRPGGTGALLAGG